MRIGIVIKPTSEPLAHGEVVLPVGASQDKMPGVSELLAQKFNKPVWLLNILKNAGTNHDIKLPTAEAFRIQIEVYRFEVDGIME